ncbi:MAG: hypothetical protein LC798_13200 [Chloroflexi bacterium]|nr:hypothetical protein [Chloroflexota bacterium]
MMTPSLEQREPADQIAHGSVRGGLAGELAPGSATSPEMTDGPELLGFAQ